MQTGVQAITETWRTEYPPTWDPTTGPTVTREVRSFGPANGTRGEYGIPWAQPFQYPQSPGADVSPYLSRLRQGYQDIRATTVVPEYVVGMTAAPVVVRNEGMLVPGFAAFLGTVVALVLHRALTSRARRRAA